MIKKVEILGIQIDNYTVAEAMGKVESFLESSAMNTIEDISMEMLVRAQEDETLRECMEGLDLCVISERDILKAAGVKSIQRLKETEEQKFFAEFMKRAVRNNRTVCLLADTGERLARLEAYLKEHYSALRILGSFSLSECVGDVEGVVNDINGVSPDVIFSVLPVPEQEYFLMEQRSKLNAGIWYGMGSEYLSVHGGAKIRRMVRRLLHKGMMRRMASRYRREE